MVDPVTAVALGGAVLNIAGGLFGSSKRKKAEKEQNRKISQLMEDTTKYLAEQRKEIESSQLQNFQRNINVMSSSGFDLNSFDRLNTWQQSQDERALALYDMESKLKISEINAGRPVSQSSASEIFQIGAQGFQTFAGLGGFGRNNNKQ